MNISIPDSLLLLGFNDNSRHGAESFCRCSTARCGRTAESLTAAQQTLPWCPEQFHSLTARAQCVGPKPGVSGAQLISSGRLSALSPLHIDCFDLCLLQPSADISRWLSDGRSISMNNETGRFGVLTLSRGSNYFHFPLEEPAEWKESARRGWRWYHAGRCKVSKHTTH